MIFRYSEWDERRHGDQRPLFEQLLDLFQQLLYHTGGDADEALRWLTALDNKSDLTDGEGLGDGIEELKNRGYIERDEATGRNDAQCASTARRRTASDRDDMRRC